MEQTLTLKGHQGPILSLAYSSSYHPLLLSGSEDSTARLWDLRCHTTTTTSSSSTNRCSTNTTHRASLCITSPIPTNSRSIVDEEYCCRDVTAVSFHPLVGFVKNDSENDNNHDSNTSTNTTTSSSYPFTVYTAVGAQVFGYDLRNVSSPIVREYNIQLDSLNGGEEINQMSFYHTFSGSNNNNNSSNSSLNTTTSCHLAVADDDGYIRVTNYTPNIMSSSSSLSQTAITKNNKLQHNSKILLQHSNDDNTLVTSIAFCPKLQKVIHHHTKTTTTNNNANGKSASNTKMSQSNKNKNSIFKYRNNTHGNNMIELISGGTDNTMHLWDLSKPYKPISSFVIGVDDSNSSSSNQIYNPPIIHSLSWNKYGTLLASGIGDGSIMIMKVSQNNTKKSQSRSSRNVKTRKQLVNVGRLHDGHDSAVACVLFPSFLDEDSLDDDSCLHNQNIMNKNDDDDDDDLNPSSSIGKYCCNERLLVSAGNDGKILFWDLGLDITSSCHDNHDMDNCDKDLWNNGDPNRFFKFHNKECKQNSDNHVSELIEKVSISEPTTTRENNKLPKIIYGIDHGRKPNCIVSNESYASNIPSSLFVGDTSNDITVYSLARS